MALTGITDAMFQYEKASEIIYKNKPKHLKAHGIARPDTRNILAVAAVIFSVLVVISEMLM
ncbi:MAG TPA: hypothetical protein VLY86_03120 [Methanothrix sp.]|nr:hypothetical protein [Methanothrix sp.]